MKLRVSILTFNMFILETRTMFVSLNIQKHPARLILTVSHQFWDMSYECS